MSNWVRAAVVAATMVGGVGVSWAEGSGGARTGADYDRDRLSREGFVPAPAGSGVEDTVPGGQLMLVAYGCLWLLVGGYLVRVTRRTAQAQRELALLQQRVDELNVRLKSGAAP